MPRRLERAAVATAIAILLVGGAQAGACTVRLGPVQATPIVYDPFVTATIDGTVSVAIDLAEGGACDVMVVLADPAGVPLREFRFGSGDRVVALRGELRETGAVHATGSPNTARVHLDTSTRHAVLIWRLLANADTVLPPGDLTLDLLAAATQGTDAAAQSGGTLILRSSARAQANIAGAAGVFAAGSQAQTIDFGQLSSGLRRLVFLQVRANVPAHLTFTSRHSGYLVNETAPQARVPYGVTFDSRPLDLHGPHRRDVTSPLTINGASYPIEVTIGEVRGALAGRYSDTITIEVSP